MCNTFVKVRIIIVISVMFTLCSDGLYHLNYGYILLMLYDNNVIFSSV